MKKNIVLSIVIVHYKAKAELFDALNSLKREKSKVTFEVIVVDNDEKKEIDHAIKKEFPWVNYIKSPTNGGFGAGNNLGAKDAQGKFIFFLNPDTIIYPNGLDALVDFLEKNKQAGIVAPLLLEPQGTPYPLQGTKSLTPLTGAFALSFINKLFPKNPISRHYWQTGWDKSKQKEVDVIPGTAFVIAKKLYTELHGFDENFFLYFEEFDLCKRVKDKGYKIYIIPTAKVMHLWGRSTQHAKNINKIFITSRKYYFKKHYGRFNSWLVEFFATFNKQKALLITIVLVGSLLRLYKINELMPFIGDQGWFYLSARDMIFSHHIALVGIASSHPWLHQGAHWTYLLAPVLWLAQWNPLAGGYLSIGIGIITILAMYTVSTEIFSEKVGLIAAVLYAVSPLAILQSRMPYHTAPIPLLTILFIYAAYKWLVGTSKALPWIFFFLGVLYNLELATAMLWFVFIPIILVKILSGLRKHEPISFKLLSLSLVAFLIPMLPMIIYDINHGYPQTLKFIAWIGYKILLLFGYPSIHQTQETFNLKQFLIFTGGEYQKLIYLPNGFIAAIIFLATTIVFCSFIYQNIKTKKYDANWLLTALWFIISILGYFAEKTPSEAYLPMLIPAIILVTALSLDKISDNLYLSFPRRRESSSKKIFSYRYNILILVLSIGIVNTITVLNQNYQLVRGEHEITFLQRLNIAKQIVASTHDRPYNLKGKGPGSQFPSFTMNYEYLTWYLGHGPSQKKQNLQVTIYETPKKTTIIYN